MGWTDVRTAIDAAIEAFERLAASTEDHSRDADSLGARIATVFDGLGNDLPLTARDHSASAATRAGDSAAGYREAARLCRDYLAAVDPDGAAGSVEGLGAPTPVGPPKGGHGPTGSPAPRQAVTDVSRVRCHVYPEQGPKGLHDLTMRDDGIVALRSGWMDAGGHARRRHGGGVTEEQLKERAEEGKDPANGSGMDWETGRPHTPVRNATAFTSDASLVFAEAAVWNSREGRAAIAEAEAAGLPRAEVIVRAADVFGPDFRRHVHGRTRIGSARNPQGVASTVFTDDTRIVTVYRRDDANSPWAAYTCYPQA